MTQRILSLGAGVQSSTLLLMACNGELDLDAAVFADTGFEPLAVYSWLDWLKTQADAAGIPVAIVSYGNIRDNELSLTKQIGTLGKYSLMPLFTRSDTGHKGRLRRNCTSRYKIEPIQKWLRAHGASRDNPIDLLMGISWDESERMTDSRMPFARHVYPLIERRMTRWACIEWMTSHGFPEPPKSACIHCPFRRTAGWLHMREQSPDDFAQAVAFDAAIRHHYTAFKDTPYLHDSLMPLNEAIDAALAGPVDQDGPYQLPMFEPDGCGVLCAADDEVADKPTR